MIFISIDLETTGLDPKKGHSAGCAVLRPFLAGGDQHPTCDCEGAAVKELDGAHAPLDDMLVFCEKCPQLDPPNFAEMLEHFAAQETILPNGDYQRQLSVRLHDGSDVTHALNAFVGFLTRRFRDYAIASPKETP